MDLRRDRVAWGGQWVPVEGPMAEMGPRAWVRRGGGGPQPCPWECGGGSGGWPLPWPPRDCALLSSVTLPPDSGEAAKITSTHKLYHTFYKSGCINYKHA